MWRMCVTDKHSGHSHLKTSVVNDKANVSRKVDLVEWDGYLRLASPNLETWAAYDGLRPLSTLSSLHSEAVNWPVRMERHCQYMADKVSGITQHKYAVKTDSSHHHPLCLWEYMGLGYIKQGL